METIVFVVIGLMCLMLGIKTYSAEEQNKIFVRYPIEVADVKKYNHFCGILIIGFGVVALITMYFMFFTDGWQSNLFALSIILEAFATTLIYHFGEKKFRTK